ncbi:MAG: S-layer homology domain-containing protein [Clostridia bacterium]|nr:S-layer homology domain-containing protein [Clostridia bacterium]
MALEEKKLLGGYDDGSRRIFKPEGNITRAEIGVILVRIAAQNLQ